MLFLWTKKGSRFHDDLAILESLDLLRLGAVVVADNVLKPGAPFFLWRLSKSGAYDTQIVTLQEFAMTSEDWMWELLLFCRASRQPQPNTR